ncbi:MAG: Rpn family recombination-promoting nuclease/putative transposase [Acidobacteriota bacterium]
MEPDSPKPPHKPSDRSHRLLFSHPRTIQDLLVGFIQEPWIAELDFTTLEKLPSDYLSGQLGGEFEERVSDVAWRVRWRDSTLHIVILLELQSSSPPDMALRMLVYVALFYQRLLKEKPLTQHGKLPPVLPIVFYNGDREWSAPLCVEELIEPVPELLKPRLPSMHYCLVDEKRLTLETLEGLFENVVAGIARVEQDHGPEYLRAMVGNFAQWLDRPEHRDLRLDVLAWLSKVVLPARSRGVKIPELHSFAEFKTYLEVNMQTWDEQWAAKGREEGLQIGLRQGRQEGRREGRQEGRREGRQEGRREGRQEGRREGRQEGRREGRREGALLGQIEGERKIFRRLFERKFDAPDAAAEERILSADTEQLISWAENLLTAKTVDEVFS